MGEVQGNAVKVEELLETIKRQNDIIVKLMEELRDTKETVNKLRDAHNKLVEELSNRPEGGGSSMDLPALLQSIAPILQILMGRGESPYELIGKEFMKSVARSLYRTKTGREMALQVAGQVFKGVVGEEVKEGEKVEH